MKRIVTEWCSLMAIAIGVFIIAAWTSQGTMFLWFWGGCAIFVFGVFVGLALAEIATCLKRS